MKTINFSDIQKRSVSWVKSNPDEAMLCLIFSGLLVVVCLFVSVYFATKTTVYPAPEPIKPASNWKFVERIQAGGGQVCDLYKRGEVSKARCYGRDSTGKWVLKGIF